MSSHRLVIHPPHAQRNTDPRIDFRFPPMPHTLAEITQIIAEQPPNTDRLVAAVQQDPVITASVLRRVNSSYYALRRQISRVDRAILLLGFREVCDLVLASPIRQTFARPTVKEERVVYEHIMKTSIACALYAKRLSHHLGLLMPDTAFTGGLLHTLGRLVMLHSVPKPYVTLWVQLSPSADHLVAPSADGEQLVFNTNHIRLGTAVAQKWGLPEELVTVIAYQHAPEQVEKPHLRQLAYTVVTAIEAARRLFEPVPDGEAFHSDALAKLARTRNADEASLVDFLEKQQDDVRTFVEAMLHE